MTSKDRAGDEVSSPPPELDPEVEARYDAAKPGDELIVYPYATRPRGWFCAAKSDPAMWTCTRQRGHRGQHVAEGSAVIHVWPQS